MNHRLFDPDAPRASIRLARIWAGEDIWRHRLRITWSEKRRRVEAELERASAEVARLADYRAKSQRAEENNAKELAALRQERRDLENKFFTVRTAPLKAEIDRKIAAIIAAA